MDGIHFDDYFYPYPTTSLTLNNSATYAKYSRGILKKDDWRRDNVNLLVKSISDSLKALKPWVKFGISPFGIWQNKSTAKPLGSATGGLESYSEIYCDTRFWLEKGYVDYVAPQLYWNIGLTLADFSILVPWWANNVFDRHLYVGHAAYRINATDAVAWQSPSQMPSQIRLVRQTPKVQGSMFYNTNTQNKNLLGFRDSLITKFYKTPSLMPVMAWKDVIAPSSPTNLTATVTNTGVQLKWTKPTTGNSEVEKIRGYVLYRFAEGEVNDISKAEAIRRIISTDTTAYFDAESSLKVFKYNYLITALDRLHNESTPSNVASSVIVTGIEEEINPQTELSQNSPNPFSDYTKINYHLAKSGNVSLRIMDLLGRESMKLLNEWKATGSYYAEFHNQSLASGIYLYILETEEGILK